MQTNSPDVLLQGYRECADTERAEFLLETLVSEHAIPDLQKAALRKLAFRDERSAVQEVVAQAAVDLAARLRGNQDAATPFAILTATAASHAATDYLRRNHPTRFRVETRVRYLHSTEKGLALWEAKGDWLCGLSEWQTAGVEPVAKAKLEQWSDLLQDVPRGRNANHPADLAFTIYDRLGAPVPLEDLTGIVQELLGLSDAQPAADAAAGDLNPARRAELADWLGKLWAQIRRMPFAERSAVLLSLRTDDDRSGAVLLQTSGVADIPALAGALDVPEGELGTIWNQLPLDDAAIAERLGVTPQGAAALRNAALEELTAR